MANPFAGSYGSATGGPGSYSPFNDASFLSGMNGVLGGLFGDSGQPYEDASNQLQQWGNKAANTQQPFYQAGVNAIPGYQNWVQGQSDPSGFFNNLMDQYQASPYSQYLQQQAMRGGQNAASASGLTSSTPLIEQMQQNSANIASGDLNQWLQHVLGINTQYGQGQQNLMQGGMNAANSLTNLYGNLGTGMADMSYNQGAAENNDFSNILGGAASIIGSLFL